MDYHFYLISLMFVASLANYMAVQALSVEVAVTASTPQQGSRVVFSCSYTTAATDSLNQISWYYGDELSIASRVANWQYDDPDMIFYYNSNGYARPRFTMHIGDVQNVRSGKTKLVIDPIRLDDTGRYWCEVLDFDGKGYGYANIEVRALPIVTERTVEEAVTTPTPLQGVRAVAYHPRITHPRVTTKHPTTEAPKRTLPLDSSATVGNTDHEGAFQFGISTSSRLEYNRPQWTFKKRGLIAFNIQTRATNGVLFHIADKSQTDKEFGFIKDGYAYYGFDYGDGPATLQSNFTINDGEWHHVEFDRNQANGIIRVDGVEVGRGNISTPLSALTTIWPLYLGGIPNGYLGKGIDPASRDSLVGCISGLQFNGLSAQALVNSFDVENCGSLKEPEVFVETVETSSGYVTKDTSILSRDVTSGNLVNIGTVTSNGLTLSMDVIICLAVILMLMIAALVFVCYCKYERPKTRRKPNIKNNHTALKESPYQDLHKGLREKPHIYACPTLEQTAEYEIPFGHHDYSEVDDIGMPLNGESEQFKGIDTDSMDDINAYQEVNGLMF